MSTMTSVRTNGVELGVETFGRDADPLVLAGWRDHDAVVA